MMKKDTAAFLHVTDLAPLCDEDGLQCSFYYHQSHCHVPDLGRLTLGMKHCIGRKEPLK